MAVDLAGQRVGDGAVGRPHVRGVELAEVLVDVERAAESLLGGDGFVPQSRQPSQQQVDLHLRAGRHRRLRIAHQLRQHRRCHACQYVLGPHPMLPAVEGVAHLTLRFDRVNLCTGGDFGTMPGGCRCECPADRTHAADRHIPFAGAAAQQVIQEADVLQQRWIVGPGERADQRIGGHHTADQIAADGFGDRVPDRPADHGLPRLLCTGITAGEDMLERVVAGLQRCRHRRPQPRGDDPGATVELGERLGIAGRTDGVERRFRPDQQAGLSAGRRIRCVRRIPASRQPHPHTEIVDDAPRQEAHQIRVAGQPSVDAVEGVRRHRRAANVVESLQHPHPTPGTGQIGGGNQSVVPAADNDYVGSRIGDQPR